MDREWALPTVVLSLMCHRMVVGSYTAVILLNKKKYLMQGGRNYDGHAALVMQEFYTSCCLAFG